jgi:hypothetical protein
MSLSFRSESLVLFAALLTVTAALALVRPSPAAGQRKAATVFGEFDGDPMYTVLEPDAIPAIRDPEFVTGDAATAQMSPSEPVIGVVIGNEAHAYSTWQLDAHEIVNDRIGGAAIAATW